MSVHRMLLDSSLRSEWQAFFARSFLVAARDGPFILSE